MKKFFLVRNFEGKFSRILTAFVFFVLIIQAYFSQSTYAFKPISLVAPSGSYTHRQITEEAIKAVFEVEHIYPPITHLLPSMKDAMEQIKDGNSDVDLSTLYLEDPPHFTGEQFAAGRWRMDHLYNGMKDTLLDESSNSGLLHGYARRDLGAVFHAIQDFYSHSNWIEGGHFDLHPGLDVVSHGGSIEFGYPNDFPNIAGVVEPTCSNCGGCPSCNNNVTTSKLTSGYFKPLYGYADKIPGKCSHGGFGDFSRDQVATGGISKDDTSCGSNGSPHAGLHPAAVDDARDATKKYIRELKTKLTTTQFKILFGLGRSFGVAIDSTASMDPVIQKVRTQIKQMVDKYSGSTAQYVLSVFNDTTLGPLTVTSDPAVFKQSLDSFPRTGDSDCPEAAWQGIRRAVEALDEYSILYVFTDASANDGVLSTAVQALAKKKNIRIKFLLSGSCSPVDGDYLRAADATGGQVIYYPTADADKVLSLVDFSFTGDQVPVLSVVDWLPTSGGSKTYTFPVDSTMSNLLIAVSGLESYTTWINPPSSTVTGVVVRQPDGTVVQQGTGVTVNQLINGGIVSVTTPTRGSWSVTVSGQYRFSLAVSAESPINIQSFNPSELAGWPGHEGYKPLNYLPYRGQNSKWVAEIPYEGVGSVQFEARRKDGSLIRTISSTEAQQPPGALLRTFLCEYNLNSFDPFIVYISGQDASGYQYQRAWSQSVEPRAIIISPPERQELVPGQVTTYDFTVSAPYLSGNVVFRGRSTLGYITSMTALAEGGMPLQDLMQNPILYLPSGTRTVRVQLTTPTNAIAGRMDLLTLSVSINDKEVDGVNTQNNVATVESRVVSIADTTAPAVFCPTSMTVSAQSGQSSAVVSYAPPKVSDNRSISSVNCSPASGTAFSVGVTTVTCTASDAAGNLGRCTFTITVTGTGDTQAPIITCPSNIALSIPYGQSSSQVNYPLPSVTDDRAGATVSCIPAPGSQFPRGVTTVSCVATDTSNNQASCSFSVAIYDVSIQDNVSGDTLLFNSITGDYIFYRCGVSGFTLSGRGTITRQGCLVNLGGDPKVSATLDSCPIAPANKGSATIKPNPIGGWIYLTDSNTTNNSRPCPNG